MPSAVQRAKKGKAAAAAEAGPSSTEAGAESMRSKHKLEQACFALELTCSLTCAPQRARKGAAKAEAKADAKHAEAVPTSAQARQGSPPSNDQLAHI